MSENINARSTQKFDLWERKLLDLTTRNALLNVKINGNIALPLMVPSISLLEDALSSGKDYVIISRNAAGEDEEGNPKIPAEEYTLEKLGGDAKTGPVLEEAVAAGKIYTSLTEKELEDRAKSIFRKAKIAIEEDGAGSLFLACGFLKWINPKDNVPCYAPLVLVPVDLKRKFGVGKYLFAKNDDDTQMNITVLEKLKQEFDILIPELDGELPSDDNGLDIPGVLNTVRGAIEAKDGWEVVESCVLGMFSFSQFVMWNDLHNHREEIGANLIVKSLLDGQLAIDYEDMEKDAATFKDEASVYLPISADSSQLYAIKRAGDGASFVLHGPPGTGKSQAITSMIANALANGKTVLFAAEKKAALDVVYTRLSKIGISPFCLELYSNKIRKGFVLDQLKEASEVRLKGAPDGDYEKALADISQRRNELDIYNSELTGIRDCGYSLYELLNIYADDMAAPDVALESGFEEGLSEDRVNATITALGELIASGKGLAGKLGFVKATVYSQETKMALAGELDELEKAANELSPALDALKASYPKLGAGSDFAAMLRIRQWIDSFMLWRNKILTSWKEGFLAIDGNVIKARYAAAEGKMALFRKGAIKKVYNEVRDYDKTGNGLSSLKASIEELCKYQADFAQVGFDTGATQLAPVMTDYIRCMDAFKAAYDKLSSRLALENECFKPDGAMLSYVTDIIASLRADEGLIRNKTIFNSCYSRCSEYKIAPVIEAFEAGVLSEGQLVPAFNKAWSKYMICKLIDSSDVLRGFGGNVFDEKVSKLKEVSDEFQKITRQEIYLKIAKRLPDLSIDASVSSGLGLLQRAIKSRGRGISIRYLMSQIAPLILQLTPCVLMSPMAAAQFIEPSKEPMFDMVIFDEASQLPTCKAVGLLARGKSAVIVGDPKQMPPTAFFKEQVAEADNFEIEDLESILDDALAAGLPQTHLLWHYRSRHESLIAFSNRSFYESKLFTFPSADDRSCKVNLQKCDGSWESGKSRTNEAEADAVAEELLGRFNDPEGKKHSYGVVTFNIQQQELIEDKIDAICAKDPAFESWAFGSSEPLFVKNLENVQGDERDVILFSVGYGPDPNGKLSMNFGPLNKEGGWRRLNVAVTRSRCEMKVFTSISPEQLRVTESTPEGVKAFKNFLLYAQGSEVWDADIAAASASGTSPVIDRSLRFTGIAEDIKARLESNGYKVDLGVGRSGFKVDIAVVDPKDEGRYCLGILIDGAGSKTGSTATTREISQPGVLQGLGWKVLRVWTVEWWEDPDNVLQDCIKAIETEEIPEIEEPAPEAEAVAEPVAEPVAETDNEAQKKNNVVMADEPFEPYQTAKVVLPEMTSAQFCSAVNTSVILSAVKQIVEEESPICFDQIVARLTGSCGIKRMTPNVKEKVDYVLKMGKFPSTIQNLTLSKDPENDVAFYWKDAEDAHKIPARFRVGELHATQVTTNEAARAAIYVCKTQYGLPREALITEAGKAMGFKVASGYAKLLIDQAIDLAIDMGELTEHGFNVRYKCE